MVNKICDWAKCYNRHESKNIGVTRLFFCRNVVPSGRSFWQKDSLFNLILFELCLLWYLVQSQMLVTTLYFFSQNAYSIWTCRISNIYCCFLQAVEKIKTNIRNSTCQNWWATKDTSKDSSKTRKKTFGLRASQIPLEEEQTSKIIFLTFPVDF